MPRGDRPLALFYLWIYFLVLPIFQKPHKCLWLPNEPIIPQNHEFLHTVVNRCIIGHLLQTSDWGMTLHRLIFFLFSHFFSEILYNQILLKIYCFNIIQQTLTDLLQGTKHTNFKLSVIHKIIRGWENNIQDGPLEKRSCSIQILKDRFIR